MDGPVVSLGHDPARYQPARRESDGIAAVVEAVSIPVACVVNSLERAHAAAAQGADWLVLDGPVFSADPPRLGQAVGEIREKAYPQRRPAPAARTYRARRPGTGMERVPLPRRTWAQAAIDTFDLESAIPIARMAMECGVDWLEVGSPLIYAEGFDAIGALKEIAGAPAGRRLQGARRLPHAPARARRPSRRFPTTSTRRLV